MKEHTEFTAWHMNEPPRDPKPIRKFITVPNPHKAIRKAQRRREALLKDKLSRGN